MDLVAAAADHDLDIELYPMSDTAFPLPAFGTTTSLDKEPDFALSDESVAGSSAGNPPGARPIHSF